MDRLLLVDDEADVLYSFRRIFNSPDVDILTASSGEEALELIPKIKPDLVIMDIRMAGMSGLETLKRLRQIDAKMLVIMMTAYGTTHTVIEAMKLGAYDYLLKPFEIIKLKQVVQSALKAARDMKQVVSCQPALESEDYSMGIVGRSEPMQKVFKLIGQLSSSSATVLITGESGTGKELIARAIYHHSLRHDKPYLAINCAAIPENLLESELFGHEKGSFSGAATQRIGKFEQCHNGTIFLDEIGDMSLTTQTKILRVLQSGSFERVGGNQPVQVDVRIIAATNKSLEKAVSDRQFREDLFYRLNVVRIHTPPLRERKDDIPLLVDYFLNKYARQNKQTPKTISDPVMSIWESYHWPGNVRELENVIQRSLVMAKSPVITAEDLPSELVTGVPKPTCIQSSTPEPITPHPITDAKNQTMDLTSVTRLLFQWAREKKELKIIPMVERELIIEALKETAGNQVQAAKLLGITRATLRKRIEKFNIHMGLRVS